MRFRTPLRGDGGALGDLGCGVYGFGVGGEEGELAVDGSLGAAGRCMGLQPAATFLTLSAYCSFRRRPFRWSFVRHLGRDCTGE
jgi:hypothetical protein